MRAASRPATPSLAVMDSAWNAISVQLRFWRTPGSKVTAWAFAPDETDILSIHTDATSQPAVMVKSSALQAFLAADFESDHTTSLPAAPS